MPSWDVRFDLIVNLSNSALVRLVERAHAFAGIIRNIPIPPYVQYSLDAVNIMRAVRGTTSIEGANLSTQDVHRILESPIKKILPVSRSRDEQEVRNARDAMHFIAELVGRQPDCQLTEALVCRLHELMTKNIPYESNVPGQYRSHAVVTGDYTPPRTGEEVRTLMGQFIEWFRVPPAINWDPIIRALTGHFYLISIHPFGDGNGRTARALESLLLYQGKVNARGFYSLANYYYQNREEYVRQLDNARFNGEKDLTPFMMFGLKGLVDELQDVHESVLKEIKIISFRDYAREQFLSHRQLGTKAGLRGFNVLLGVGRDGISLADVYAHPLYRGVTRRTVQRDLKFLKEHELVLIDNGRVSLNVDVMNQFMAIEQLKSTAIQSPKPRRRRSVVRTKPPLAPSIAKASQSSRLDRQTSAKT